MIVYKLKGGPVFLSYLYLKTGRRQPVRLRQAVGILDPQAQIPWGWCSKCATEVYEPGKAVCDMCKEVTENGKSGKSL